MFHFFMTSRAAAAFVVQNDLHLPRSLKEIRKKWNIELEKDGPADFLLVGD